MIIAITGATGQLGRLVIERLKARIPVDRILALARDPSKAADLGVAVREADYDRSETLGTALAGVDTLLLISSSEVGSRTPQHQAVIEAAQAAGVGRIVYTSLLHADVSPLGLAGEHRDTEAMLKASGLPFTILRNGWYTENYAASIPGALASGALMGSAREGRIASATRADYADAAVAALLDEAQAGRTIELAGDQSYTLADLAAEVSRQAGRDIPYKDMPPDEYASALQGFGLPEAMAQMYAGMDECASRGALFDDGRALSALIGRPTTPLAASIAAALS